MAYSERSLGSSPLARGLLSQMIAIILPPRIIPARAGFTAAAPPMGDVTPDHPRSRGVYAWEPVPVRRHLGSSPLARGLRCPRTSWSPAARIIPARAGFTHRGHDAGRSDADHPRSRGVYEPPPPPEVAEVGSSPLARGLPWSASNLERTPRIIPARAGFTAPRTHPRHNPRDHPRSRGVYTGLYKFDSGGLGSSPLARGLPRLRPA